MAIILPTKKFVIEFQPNGKTIFRLLFQITDTKAVRAANKEQAREMLDMVIRFENHLCNLKRELLQTADLGNNNNGISNSL